MLSRKSRVTNLTVLAVLAFSTFATSLAYAAPIGNNGKDWQYVNGNSWGWNYSPQTQINKDNLNNLEVKWLFPLGASDQAPAALRAVQSIGSGAEPPLVVNGNVYITTHYKKTFAIDAKTGKQIWSYQYGVSPKDIENRLPITITMIRHTHGNSYWEKGNAILNYGIGCDFYGIDVATGKEKFRVDDLCKDIPGNLYKYGANYNFPGSTIVGTYDKGRQFIYVQPGTMHSTLKGPDARHVTMGVSMDAPYKVLWRVFSSPPYDAPVKDWALQECDIGFFQTYPCKDVAAKNRAGLEWDFALPGEPISKWAGVTANWGQMVVDEDTGIVYTQTGNQGPYSNMSLAPGPRLYGSTIMAIDINQGKRIWWLQPFPHDPYDYDCNWNGILAEVKGIGKVYVKGCKEGILYAMDAKTGKPAWTQDTVKDQVSWGQIGPAASKTLDQGGVKYYRPDPFSQYDLREWNWISYPAKTPGEKGKVCTLPCDVYPYWSNGLFGTDISYDPQASTVFHYAVGLQVIIMKENPYVQGGDLFITKAYPTTNTTIVARDAATGQVKWTWFYKYSQQRAAMIVSGGMVLTGFTDGQMRFFDKDSGKLLKELPMGAGIVLQPSIGSDSDGNSKIFALLSGGDYPRVNSREYATTLVALGLSDKPAVASTTTVTTTQSTTITTTSATTSVSTTTATTTATTATTVTSQVTQTSGLPAEITYAAVGVAVIAIIGAAVLVMRKK